ncbi:MAG: hypothetical protein ACOYM3_24925 [Terrimicrobiaceae bacterium]
MPSEADWKTNYLQVILGQLPEQYLRARSFAQELKALAKAAERRGELTRTLLTGHSLGGGSPNCRAFSGAFDPFVLHRVPWENWPGKPAWRMACAGSIKPPVLSPTFFWMVILCRTFRNSSEPTSVE